MVGKNSMSREQKIRIANQVSVNTALAAKGMTRQNLATGVRGLGKSSIDKFFDRNTKHGPDVLAAIENVLDIQLLRSINSTSNCDLGSYPKSFANSELVGKYKAVWPSLSKIGKFNMYDMNLEWVDNASTVGVMWDEVGRNDGHKHVGKLAQLPPSNIFYFVSTAEREFGKRIIFAARNNDNGNFEGFLATLSCPRTPKPMVAPISIIKDAGLDFCGIADQYQSEPYEWCKRTMKAHLDNKSVDFVFPFQFPPMGTDF